MNAVTTGPERAHSIPRHYLRSRLAEVVHRAVREVSGTDGVGRCIDYAVAGALLLKKALKRTYHLQAGSLSLLADPPDGVVMIDATDGGLSRGEFHVWLARPEPDLEIVDFSSRHFRSYVERFVFVEEAHGPLAVLDRDSERIPWTRPDPDPYIWTQSTPVPYARFTPVPEACHLINEIVVADPERVGRFYDSVVKYYRA